MENERSIFSLSIDPVAKSHFSEAAKWARFLAIVGFISLGLLVVFGIVFAFTISRTMSAFETTGTTATSGVFGVTTGITYLFFAAVYFFPLLYLLRFANAMRTALAANDNERLITAGQNLKACFRFIGILTIIGLAFMVIGLLVGIAGLAFMGR